MTTMMIPRIPMSFVVLSMTRLLSLSPFTFGVRDTWDVTTWYRKIKVQEERWQMDHAVLVEELVVVKN